jgi:hypothetical protein
MASNWLANPKMGYQVFPVYPVPVLTIQVRISSQGKPCFHYRDGFAVREATLALYLPELLDYLSHFLLDIAFFVVSALQYPF